MISLKVHLTHVCDQRSDGLRVQCINARSSSRFPSDAPHRATRPAIKEIEGNIVPHGEKDGESSGI